MRLLLWLYPRRWRRRYGDEFLAVLEERGLSLMVLLDVLRGALDAWLHPELFAMPATAGASANPARRRGRLDKFTGRSRRVLELAADEAARLRYQQIETGHLLLALLLEGEGVAAHILADRGMKTEELRAAILARTRFNAKADPWRLGLAEDAKRAIELSIAEANRLHHDYVGTEHLLLGLVAEGQGVAADILGQRNAGDLAELRSHIVRVLNEGGPHLRRPA